jgi:VCBS repeat-containing protein
VTITGTNDGPVAVADVAAGTENQSLTIDVLGNDTDVDDGHLFTLNSASAPASQGTASVVGNQLLFNPGSDFDHLAQGVVEHVTLSYQMQDQYGAISNSTVDVTITGTNDGPVAVADVAAGTENQPLTIDVLGNDTDVDDNHVFTLNSASAPDSKGTASVVGNQLQFNPGADFDHLAQGAVEHVTLSYQMQDQYGAISNSTVDVTITGTNDGPVAVADVAAGTENQTLTLDVLANDTDVDDGHLFTLNSASAPASQGTASVVGNQLLFNPGSDFDHLAQGAVEHVTLSYQMQDQYGAISNSTVDVTITGTNDAPVAVADAAAGTENQTLTIDVLSNDTDVDDNHVFTLNSASAPASQGTASVVGNQLLFNPGADFDHLAQGVVEHVTLSYQMQDEHGALSSSTVDVTITGTNDAPVITSGSSASEAENSPTTNVVYMASAHDVDAGDTTFTYSLGGTDAGLFDINASTGVVTFKASPNYEAPSDANHDNVYDITVTATDAHGLSGAAQGVAITVTNVSETPTTTISGIDISADSGNANDFNTNIAAQTITGTLSTALVAGESLLGSVDAGAHWIDVTSKVSGTAISWNGATLTSGSSIEFKVFNTDGNSGPVNSQAYVLDTSPPAAPTVTGFASDSGVVGDHITNDTTLTINGTAEAGSTVQVFRDGVSIGIVVAPGGNWSLVDGMTLSNGTTYQYTAQATDTAGNASTASTSYSVTIDTAVPSAPSITSVTDDVAPVTGTVANNGSTNDTTPTLSGTAEANSVVTIKDGATTLGTVTANGSGAWSFTTAALSQATHSFTATATDAASNTGTASTSYSVTVDTTPPASLAWSYNNGQGKLTATTDTSGVTRVAVFDNTTSTSLANATNQGAGTWTLTQAGINGHNLTVTAFDAAGNSTIAMHVAPAGVAGQPINLALEKPSGDLHTVNDVSITNVPSDWTINGATKNADGSWSAHTSDLSSMTVMTPIGFVGAAVLNVTQTWINPNGTTSTLIIANNVEAYAPGSPIFVLSADDNLTGSSGADLFVFAQPIGNNVIHSFDVVADKIDLIGFTGVIGFAGLSIANDANGNALVDIGSGQTVTLKGVDAANLSETNFQFDVDPLTTNTGTISIADGAIMPFGGSIHNSGTIELGSTGSATDLEILFRGATLTGGGHVLLSDSAHNVIFGGSADTVLTNVDNHISGAGQLGAGQMVLVNAGLIQADGLNSLVLDTGTHTIVNSGVLESTGAGGMTVASAVDNSGDLWANGGDLRLLADVTGNGSATIDGDASLIFNGAAHASVAFHGEGAGTLIVEHAADAGSLVGILGFESNDSLMLGDLAFGANTQLSYSANALGSGGLLTVDDGVHRAEVNLLGHYSVADFQVTDGGGAGTLVDYHGASSGTQVGSMQADVLSGGDGNDILAGRGGADTLSGGAGADVFAYLSPNDGGDTILDYNFAEGDALDLSALLKANFVSGSSQVSDFVQLVKSGSDITVKVDTDGAANGAHFTDVAVLANAGTTGVDLVRTWFGDADHTLTT